MIKALLLVLEPAAAWEKVVRAQRSIGFIIAVFLLPLLTIGCAAEAYGLMRWGKARKFMALPKTYSLGEAVLYEVALFVAMFLIIVVAAQIIKMLGQTFHGRNTFSQAFTAVAYGLSPLFALRVLDAFTSIPWPVAWGIGIALSVATLYQGLPRVMLPDPPHAFGLYLMSAILLTLITGLLRYVTAEYLNGEFEGLEKSISRLAEKLPF
jgi:uncharacterized membrane protein YidH (DUF202 family)